MHGHPKVFGIGLSRTGTTSLTAALRILGYKSIHYPLCLVRIKGDELHLDTKCVERYDALTDIPVARFYKELDQAFPGSKFILTVRDTTSWKKSMKRLQYSLWVLGIFPKVSKLVRDIYGTSGYSDSDALVAQYERYVRDVRAHFSNRPSDLLVLDLTQKRDWEQLCVFLGKPIPHRAFPWQNRGYGVPFRNILDFVGIAHDRRE